MNYDIKKTHISNISAGDTIICPDGFMRTISGNNIKRGGFYGTTLFGNSYNAGTIKVDKVIFKKVC